MIDWGPLSDQPYVAAHIQQNLKQIKFGAYLYEPVTDDFGLKTSKVLLSRMFGPSVRWQGRKAVIQCEWKPEKMFSEWQKALQHGSPDLLRSMPY